VCRGDVDDVPASGAFRFTLELLALLSDLSIVDDDDEFRLNFNISHNQIISH